MKSLDYFYEEILSPILSDIGENVVEPMLETLLLSLYWIMLPLWIVPYLIFRGKKGGTK
jgi:hypothetical protein